MNRNKIIWGILSLIIAVLSIWAVMSQSKNFTVDMLVAFVREANPFWIVMAFITMFGFIWFEGYAIIRIARCFGYKQNAWQGTIYGAGDVYFSAITPSASGGQPASAYFMMKDGMSGPAVTITLLLNLIMYTLALFSLGIVSMIFGHQIFFQFSLLSRLLIGAGSIVLIVLAVLFWLLICRATILYALGNQLIIFLEKIHLIRHADKKREKLNQTMKDYQECAMIITHHRKILIEAFVWNVCQRLSQLFVSFMIFMAMKRGLKMSISAVFVQCFVALGSNTVPIPGSMGVADYIMLDGFNALVGVNDGVTVELLCRGITFYGCVLTGGILVIIGYLLRRKKNVRIL